MKKYLTILFICLLQNLFAQTTYYVAANGNDANNGTSTSTPWQSLSKINATTFAAGDSILFRRGDTFYGSIIPKQGSQTNFGAYGSGNKPIITGFQSVTAWTNKGGNIWESTNAVSTLPTMGVVVMNGQNIPMGKYPNGDVGYPYLPNFFTFTAHTGTGAGASSIVSSSLTGGNNWTGADVVIRINQWTFHREVITSQNVDTLNFDGVDGSLVDGWGFFIQNDIRTLDQQNEWYYNPSTHKLSIYSTTQPTNVMASTVDTLINFYSNVPQVGSLSLDNLDIQGGNTHNVWASGNLTFSLTNCKVSFSGQDAIMLYGGGIKSATVNSNTFTSNGQGSLNTSGTISNITMIGNSVNMSGVISTYLRNNYGNGGISFTAPYSLIQYNTVDSSAYCGINFNGDSVKVINNFVNHSAVVRGDAGGIYSGYVNNGGKVIDHNIILNSLGNPRGSGSNDYFAMGIYSDDFGNNMQITNNTVINARTSGIYIHNSNNLYVRNNTIYNCGSLAGESMWANGSISIDGNGSQFANSLFGNQVLNNIIFAKTPYQYALNYYAASATGNQVGNFGTIDSNYYVKINNPSTEIKSQQDGINGDMTLASWQTQSTKDAHSNSYSSTITDSSKVQIKYNETNAAKVVALDANYKDVKGNTYPGTVTIQPYSSVVLIYDSPISNPPPTVSTSGNQTLVSTVTSTNVFSTPTPASGESITAFAWTQISGATASITSPTSQNTGITGLQIGTSVFRITVTQTDGQTGHADVSVTLTAPPTANAGTSQTITLPTSSVNLSGSGTVASGQTASCLWTKISGSGTQTIANNTTLTPTISGLSTTGDYVFQLKVTQTDNQFATSTVTIHVNPSVTPQQPFVLFPVPIKVIQLH